MLVLVLRIVLPLMMTAAELLGVQQLQARQQVCVLSFPCQALLALGTQQIHGRALVLRPQLPATAGT
jgi:hypothetical protein